MLVGLTAILSISILNRQTASDNPLIPAAALSLRKNPKFRIQNAYGRLPLSFEANHGQTDSQVKFLARGGSYTIFLTHDEAVLVLRKSQPGVTRFGKRGFPGRLDSFGPLDPPAGSWPSFPSVLKSLRLIPALSQLVPQPNAGKDAVAAGLESQPPQVVRMRLVGGNAKRRVVGLADLPGRSNYFIGHDPKKWRSNVPNYARVKYEGVYPGIDLLYYGNQGQLEYDFVVAPGADPNQIKLSFAGVNAMRVDAASGDLVLKLGNDEVRLRKPAVYQPAVAATLRLDARHAFPPCEITRHSSVAAALDGTFVLANDNEVAFRVAGYDPKRTLVIDPVLSYSTFLGGSDEDLGSGIAVDSSGNAYVTGKTWSTDFPTVNPFQPTNKATPTTGYPTVFVAKLNSTGSALVYSTYLGGSNEDDGFAIAVDSSGNAYVTGLTYSTDFPTANPFQSMCLSCNQSSHNSYSAFVAKLNPTGNALVYSTYLGGTGNDQGNGIAVDSSGNAYVTGWTSSAGFPTANPLQATYGGSDDAFVTKLNAAGSALVYSTYLGGSSYDFGTSIAVDSSGDAYVTGETWSTDFPTVNPFQATCSSCSIGYSNVFVAELNAAGSALVYSTYLGGSGGDYASGIAVDSSGNAYVTGHTSSTNFPTANPLQAINRATAAAGKPTAFIAKLNSAGSALVYSTYLGGSSEDYGNGIAVDPSGNAYVTGYTISTDFPTADPFQATCGGCSSYSDAFVAELNAAGSALVYSSYLGGSVNDYGFGIAVDSSGDVFLTGQTYSIDFPTGHPLQNACGGCDIGSSDAFVAKILPAGAEPLVVLSPTSMTLGAQIVGTTSAPQTVTLTNVGTANLAITSIMASGDFSQTNTCGTTVSTDGDCTISVTFTPTAGGNRTGTITISDNGPNSPQTIALSGTGEDFALAATSTSATVAPGQPATYTLSVTGEGGFSPSVSFTCTGAPSEATCTVSPNPVTLGSSATNVTVSVTTAAPSSSAPRSRPLPPLPPLSPDLRGLLMLALVLAAMARATGRRRPSRVNRWQTTMVPFTLGLLLALVLAGCGGGGGSAIVSPNPGTPPGTYTLTITGSATSGSVTLSHSLTLTLIVS
jgi:hypothetical protein